MPHLLLTRTHSIKKIIYSMFTHSTQLETSIGDWTMLALGALVPSLVPALGLSLSHHLPHDACGCPHSLLHRSGDGHATRLHQKDDSLSHLQDCSTITIVALQHQVRRASAYL